MARSRDGQYCCRRAPLPDCRTCVVTHLRPLREHVGAAGGRCQLGQERQAGGGRIEACQAWIRACLAPSEPFGRGTAPCASARPAARADRPCCGACRHPSRAAPAHGFRRSLHRTTSQPAWGRRARMPLLSRGARQLRATGSGPSGLCSGRCFLKGRVQTTQDGHQGGDREASGTCARTP